jgi:AraC-like DNA-binding protein
LLLGKPFSLEKIAERAGFEHAEYLSVAFKWGVGMTPGEFRRQFRQTAPR